MYVQGCIGNDNAIALNLPAVSFVVSRQTPVMTFAGDWREGIPGNQFGGPNTIGPFIMCTTTTAAAKPNSDGIDKNLYVGGSKPPSVYPAPGNLTVSEDGVTYPVFTTAALQQVGLGYVVRWRVTNGWGEFGQWTTPPSHNWSMHMPPASTGMPFWRFWIYNQQHPHNSWGDGGDIQGRSAPTNVLNSLNDWYDILAARDPAHPWYVILYGAQVATRFVLIQDPLTIVGANALNPISKNVSIQLEILRQRPLSHSGSPVEVAINQTVIITLPPTGSCTTPSVDPSTVNFGTVLDSDLPNQGSATAYRNLDLTFTNCPRINIGYYVHANGKWVNSTQGIVGLPGSTPNPDPVAGNPRGFGIQLAHRTGSPDGSGPVYISSHDTDPNKQVYWRINAQGTSTNTGVTHTIRLRARVIRTHPDNVPIIPGAFNTSVIVAIQYQ